MEDRFSRLKAEASKIDLPNECEENDRAVKFLALETGVGHYDNLNLLVLAVLVIFISVSFLAVSSGKIRNEEELTLTKESFLSGEFEKGLEERYIRELPMIEQLRSAEEHISFLYGFGNTISEKSSGNYDTLRERQQADTEHNAFEPDDEEHDENAVTTKAVMTDKDGNTVTEADDAQTAPGGGTTAVSRPASTYKTYSAPEDEEDITTTNNDAPPVTTTTTEITAQTEPTHDTDDTSEPTDTDPPVTDEPDSKPDTAPPDTEPPYPEDPAE